MQRPPFTFEHRKKTFCCHFVKIGGAGDCSTFHLYDHNNYFLGRLRKDANDDWVFDGSNPNDELQYLAGFFGNYVSGKIE